MRTISIIVALSLVMFTGCKPGGIFGGDQLMLRYTFIANGESRVVPLNVEGKTLGNTGEEDIPVSFKDHEITFGNPDSIKQTDAFSVPIVEIEESDGTISHYIHEPVEVTVEPSSAREDMGLDSATPPVDTATPVIDNGLIISTAIGSFLAEGIWTCRSADQTEISTTEVSYPDASTVTVPIFGNMAIEDIRLHRADNGTNEVFGNFSIPFPNVTVIMINVNPTDGSNTEVGQYDCWAGQPADNPWENR